MLVKRFVTNIKSYYYNCESRFYDCKKSLFRLKNHHDDSVTGCSHAYNCKLKS
jgi:hypothetical protein